MNNVLHDETSSYTDARKIRKSLGKVGRVCGIVGPEVMRLVNIHI